VYDENIESLKKILIGKGCNKKPAVISSVEDINFLEKIADSMKSTNLCPIFSVSNVTGEGIEQLKSFISKLPLTDIIKNQLHSIEEETKEDNGPDTEFVIDGVYLVTGVGIVTGGTITKGQVKINQTLYLGPDKNGTFRPIIVKSMQENRVDVEEASVGQTVCLNIKSANKKDLVPLKTKTFRKGMVLVDKIDFHGKKKNEDDLNIYCIREFDAEVVVLHHATTIQQNYQAVVHAGVIRQTAKVVKIFDAKELMRTGDKGNIRFKFMYNPEFLKVGDPYLLK